MLMRWRPWALGLGVMVVGGVCLGATPPTAHWRGLVVAPEVRCAPYDADDYRYPASVEARIVAALGGVYGPYTGRWFASPRRQLTSRRSSSNARRAGTGS